MTGPSVPVEEISRFLPSRVLSLLLRPRRTWAAIANEPASIGGLYVGAILPLSALLPAAMVWRWSVLGWTTNGIIKPGQPLVHTPLSTALTWALTSYGLGLVVIYAMALVINHLAPRYGGTPGTTRALKVMAYAPVAYWLGAALAMVWLDAAGLATLGVLLAVYSGYLLYTGLQVVMGATRRVPRYLVVVGVWGFVLYGAADLYVSSQQSPAGHPSVAAGAIIPATRSPAR